MTVDDDKTTSGDNITVPKFDHSNKTVSRDSRIRAYTQSFKCAAMAKYDTVGGALAITKAGATPPLLHFAENGKIGKVAPAFYARDPEVFKTRLLDEGWEPDSNHVVFAPFATACFHSICTRYLEQTSSHLIGKLKSFVMARMSFGKHVKNPLKWTSSVESSWHELQGAIKRFDPEALTVLELVLDVYNSGDHQWAQWATSFYEQHSDRAFTVGEVLQSFSRRDKKAPKLSSADTTVTMTPAAQESFKQRRKFRDVKKNAKHWSKKGGTSSSSGPPLAKKTKSATVHMIITSDALDDDSTEHPSKTALVASPDVEDADQSEDDDSDVDHQLEGAASSSKSGGVTSCSKSDDKARDSTKSRCQAHLLQVGAQAQVYKRHLREAQGPHRC
jgi:hypothetical protein